MSKVLAGAIGCYALAACASHPQPTEHLAASIAAVRGAETAGAAQVPRAALHLKLAEEQNAQAREMVGHNNERADSMAIRAYNDAELALALTREAQSKQRRESYGEAHPKETSEPVPGTGGPPLDATNPPGADAPTTPASSAGTVKP